MMGGAPGSDIAKEQESKQRVVMYGPKIQLQKEMSIHQQESLGMLTNLMQPSHFSGQMNLHERSFMSSDMGGPSFAQQAS